MQANLEDQQLNEFELVDEGADMELDVPDPQEEDEYEWVYEDEVEEGVDEAPVELFAVQDALDEKPRKRNKFINALRIASKGTRRAIN